MTLDQETRLTIIVAIGVAFAAIGLFWLLVAAFRVKWPWGLAVLLVAPIAAPIFAVRHSGRAAKPLILLAFGLIVGSGPIIYNRLTPVDLGPREKVVNGDLHLTLTGWDRHDYSVLGSKPETIVLQMANPDVTDATLVHLKRMSRLRELDLNGSMVGDDGLKELEPLANLESLRLKDTKITETGFRAWLQPREALKQLDLRGTAVSKGVGKAWREARPGRRLLQ